MEGAALAKVGLALVFFLGEDLKSLYVFYVLVRFSAVYPIRCISCYVSR
jgi:hypothetical protein